jgi:hypothetical protein
MDRRKFLGFLAGGSVAVAPSLLWPFRKIFLPIVTVAEPLELLAWHSPVGLFTQDEITPLEEYAVQAIELEAFAKSIPDLFFRHRRLYEFFKNGEPPLTSLPWPGKLNIRLPSRYDITARIAT